jgi:hypothetical protein
MKSKKTTESVMDYLLNIIMFPYFSELEEVSADKNMLKKSKVSTGNKAIFGESGAPTNSKYLNKIYDSTLDICQDEECKFSV